MDEEEFDNEDYIPLTEIEIKEGIEDLFKEILGVKPKIKNDFPYSEKENFINIIKILDERVTMEEELFNNFGIDTQGYVGPYITIIEHFLHKCYGTEHATLIMWYVFLRKENSEYVSTSGKVYKNLNEPEDLWNYINNRNGN